MGFKLEFNISELTKNLKDSKKRIQEELVKAAQGLASATHAKLTELATERLKSRQKTYKDNIEFSNPAENIWVVTLKEGATWIEDGMQAGSQLPGLLKNPKITKDGKKFKVIPFLHSKAPTEQSTKAKSLTDAIKDELKARKISYSKIERNPDGSPRVGLLHKFDVDSARAGGNKDKLKGVSVYQTKKKDGSVRRDVLTFRIAHEDHAAQGKWMRPATPGVNLMDETMKWAIDTWEKQILPDILKDV